MKRRTPVLVFLALAILAPLRSVSETTSPRAIQLPDILAWRSIRSTAVSTDGAWFAYRVAPYEGDAEVVLRNLGDGKEQRFPAGEIPSGDADVTAGGRDLALSFDSKWLAFLTYPSAKEATALRKQKKPLQTNAVLVE